MFMLSVKSNFLREIKTSTASADALNYSNFSSILNCVLGELKKSNAQQGFTEYAAFMASEIQCNVM